MKKSNACRPKWPKGWAIGWSIAGSSSTACRSTPKTTQKTTIKPNGCVSGCVSPKRLSSRGPYFGAVSSAAFVRSAGLAIYSHPVSPHHAAHYGRQFIPDRPPAAARHADFANVCRFDIVVIGTLAPLSFVAKSEVKSWPLFGQLAIFSHLIYRPAAQAAP